jgi:surfactin synthase thioesterase subunit
MKLICFPYAGAAASVFLKWEKQSNGKIQVLPVDFPGRGRRMAEPLFETIPEIVEDLKKHVLSIVDEDEMYAVYGHSMGSLLIYELLHELMKSGFTMPVHVFLSGKNPPDVPVKEPVSQMENSELIKRIVELGGTDPKLFENQTLSNVYIPIIRKDFRLLETYKHPENRDKLPVDMTFFFAVNDNEVSIEKVKAWSDFITGSFQLYYFSGGHFFFFDRMEKMAEIMTETLSEIKNTISY